MGGLIIALGGLIIALGGCFLGPLIVFGEIHKELKRIADALEKVEEWP